jgi:very-short-patch-repair endonuclease
MNKEKLQNLANSCFNKTELAKMLGYTYYNGRITKKINDLVDNYEIDISHFDSSLKNKQRTIYDTITKECPQCGVKFETKKDHPKEKTTCSHACSNIFIKRKPSETYKTINCVLCGDEITVKKQDRNKKNCDNCETKKERTKKKLICIGCGKVLKKKTKYGKCKECYVKDDQYKKLCSERMKKRVEDGIHSGWKVRSKNNPSYPEQFFMKVLDNNDIEYEFELPSCGFFIDFAIGNIALEIDGKQHLEEDRKERDRRKDKALEKEGWLVYRIPWKSINSKSGKQYIKEEIEKFLDFYRMYFKENI